MLKVVSEKGVDKVKKENAQQKFAENKKAAYIRETNKFGKDYADMSYKEDEEKEIDWISDNAIDPKDMELDEKQLQETL